MFCKWFTVGVVSALAAGVQRANEPTPREVARNELVKEVTKTFPELAPLATSKEAAPEATLSDLELYVDTFLPSDQNKIAPDDLIAAREALLAQVTHVIDSPLVPHGGLDRKQVAPFVMDGIRSIVKATHPAARQALKPKPARPIKETPVHISLVQSDEGKGLIAKWKDATDYRSRSAVCEQIVSAGAEGARVIIELGRDPDVRKDDAQTHMLSKCLIRIGEAAKPALLEYLNLPEPVTGVELTRAIAAWPSVAIEELIQRVSRDNERNMISGIYWVFGISQMTGATAAMKGFVVEALDHPSPKVQATAVSRMTSMMSSDRAGHSKAWMTPPIDRIERMLAGPDATVRAAGFRFFATTDRNAVAYAAAKKAVYDDKEDRHVRYAAAQALAANAPDDDALIQEAVKLENLLPRIEAAYVDGLQYRELPEAVIPILCRWLVPAEDYYMGTNAAAAHLKNFGPKAVPSLLKTVARAEWPLVCKSLSVLSEIPGGDTSISDTLRPRLSELATGGPRYNLDPVFMAIARAFPPDEAFKTLANFGNHPEAGKLGLRPAIDAIGQIRPVSERAIFAVGDILQRPDDGLRYHAIQAAGHMGADGGPLVGDLLDIIESDSKRDQGCLFQMRRICAVSSAAEFRRLLRLAENEVINQHESVTAIVGCVLDREPAYFETIRQEWNEKPGMFLKLAVANIGSPGVRVLKLPADIEDKVFPLLVNQYVTRGHGMVQEALVSVGKRDQRVIDEARKRVSDEAPSTGGEALKLMARLRPVEAVEKRLVLESLESDDKGLRGEAAAACGYLGPEASDALPRLLQIAQTPGGSGRHNAIRAIGEIAPSSPEILNVLWKIAEEPYPGIRAVSEKAQRRITERHARPN